MIKRTALLTTVALAATALPATAGTQKTSTRDYEGTVVSVDGDAKTFRLRDSERGTVTIRVTGRTRFERLAGLRSLRSGMRNVEAAVRRSDGRWVAVEVERSGGGGEHGAGDDHGRGDDNGGERRGRGSDDRGGDDHRGGRGRGSDDRGGDDHRGRGSDDRGGDDHRGGRGRGSDDD